MFRTPFSRKFSPLKMIAFAAGATALLVLPMQALGAHAASAHHDAHRAKAAPQTVSASDQGALLPDRVLDCTMGHLTNFDPTKDQTAADLRYDGFHSLRIYLPAIPPLKGPPPDVNDPPVPVNPRTRILADPDHISAQTSPVFERVVDQWPQHVELSAPTGGPMQIVYVLDGYDAATASANLFMMPAYELTHFDPAHMYRGTCHVTLDAAARAVDSDARAAR